MKTLKIFGKEHHVVHGDFGEEGIEFHNGKIYVNCKNTSTNKFLKEGLSDYLYTELIGLYEQIRKENKLEILGDIKFEVKDKVDDKKNRIAKLKHNKITVKLNAISLPEEALKYMMAHEIAHLVTKKHNTRFWKTVETIYPEYRIGRDILEEHENDLRGDLI